MKIHKQYTIGGNKILSFGFITQLISNQSKIALKLKILLLVLGVFIGCQKKNTNTFGSEPENRDPLEKSARLKAGLPWYARYQVGDPVVKGFPEETTEEKRRRLQSWRDAKFGLFIHWGPQAGAAEYKLSKEELDSFNPVDFDAEEWVLMAKRLGFKYMVITPKHHAGLQFMIPNSPLTIL